MRPDSLTMWRWQERGPTGPGCARSPPTAPGGDLSFWWDDRLFTSERFSF